MALNLTLIIIKCHELCKNIIISIKHLQETCNIKNLYQCVSLDIKAVKLSTISNIYSANELEQLGHKATYRHYYESLKIKISELDRNINRKYIENIECKEIVTEY